MEDLDQDFILESYIKRLDKHEEIIKLLLSRLTDLAEENLGGAKWDHFFTYKEGRKIIDFITSENKLKKEK